MSDPHVTEDELLNLERLALSGSVVPWRSMIEGRDHTTALMTPPDHAPQVAINIRTLAHSSAPSPIITTGTGLRTHPHPAICVLC